MEGEITINVSIQTFTNSDLTPSFKNKNAWLQMESGEYISPRLYEVRRSLHCLKSLKWLKDNGYYNEYK